MLKWFAFKDSGSPNSSQTVVASLRRRRFVPRVGPAPIGTTAETLFRSQTQIPSSRPKGIVLPWVGVCLCALMNFTVFMYVSSDKDAQTVSHTSDTPLKPLTAAGIRVL